MSGIAYTEDARSDMRGAVHLEIRRAGELIEVDDDHNLIVTAGRTLLARLLGGDYGGHITHVAVGTNGNTADAADTALANPVRVPITSAEYSASKVRFNFTIGTGVANGMLIREFGLLFTDGVLFSRRVRKSIIGKEDDIQITGYWEIYF